MESLTYTPPVSWDDKGMDWSSPDPANIDYVMAIREAIVEKAIITGYAVPASLFRLSPYAPLNTDVLTAIRDVIYALAANFVDMAFKDYQPDGADFPRMYDYGTLILPEDCRICELPPKGAPINVYCDFLTAAKNVLDNLTVILNTKGSGTTLSRDGANHDPPSVSETINESVKRAMGNEPSKGTFSSFPQTIWNKSGTTHYTSTPGYCGYVSSRSLKIVMDTPPIPDAKCKIIIATFAGKVTGLVGYSAKTQYNDYDKGPLDVPDGMDIRDFGEWKEKITIELGDVDFFPKYPKTPSSQWEPQQIRHGAWLGCEVKIHCLLDFGIPGGFKFQK
ncbi:MAG: hypothetical protein RRY34_03210 [Victivallaceae bacterium]